MKAVCSPTSSSTVRSVNCSCPSTYSCCSMPNACVKLQCARSRQALWSSINDERYVGHLLHRTRGALADAIAGNVSEHAGVVMIKVSQNASGPGLCSHRNDLRRVLFLGTCSRSSHTAKTRGNSSMPTALVLRRLLPDVAQVAATWKDGRKHRGHTAPCTSRETTSVQFCGRGHDDGAATQ